MGQPPLYPDGIITSLGTPGSAQPPATQPGQANIWNLPKDVQGQTIWFDNQPGGMVAVGPEGQGRIREPNAPARGTAESVMKQVAAMANNDPAKFIAIQSALAAVGSWGTVHVNGSWNAETSRALATAMGDYWQLTQGASTPISFQQYLMDAAAKATQLNQQQTKPAPPPPTYNVTDPEAIKAAAQSAAQAALGQGMSDAQLQQFVSQFQSAQLGAEKQVGGTATAPDLQSQAMQFVQQADPKMFQSNQRAAYTDALVNMLQPAGGSARPNMTPVPSV